MSDPTPHGGKQTVTDTTKDSIDELIATDLARANLYRLRAEYDAAEALCMDLLKRFPNNATVASLLGDIAAEQNQLESAKTWYEMALDAGASSGIDEKLHTLRVRLNEREARKTEAGIGLPSRSLPSPALVLGAVVCLLFLLTAAYMAGNRQPAPVQGVTDHTPIQLPKNSSTPNAPTAQQTDTPKEDTPATQPPATTSAVAKTDPDPVLAPLLADQSGALAKITAAYEDPRNGNVTIEANLQSGDDARALAATIVSQAYAKLKDSTQITIRMMSAGKPVFVADAPKDKLDAAASAADSPTLADQLFINEWKPAGR